MLACEEYVAGEVNEAEFGGSVESLNPWQYWRARYRGWIQLDDPLVSHSISWNSHSV